MRPRCMELPAAAPLTGPDILVLPNRISGGDNSPPPFPRVTSGGHCPDKRDLLLAETGSGKQKIKGEISKFRPFSWQALTAPRGKYLSAVQLET